MESVKIPIAPTAGEGTVCRIPGLICTSKGTLIAYYECRRSLSDWAEIDLKWIRSHDRGESWETAGLLRGEGQTLNNPVMIVDGDRIHFLFCKNYREIYHAVSDDDGVHFSEPRALSGVPEGIGRFFNAVAIGPGHGVVHQGRLLVPLWFAHNAEDSKAHHPSFISTLYSEDGGGHWQVGEVLTCPPEIPDPNESALAVTAEGRVMLSIRNEGAARMRALAFSDTGIGGWTVPKFESNLPDPVCQGSLFHKDGVLFHSNCATREKRRNLTVKVSTNAFHTYRELLVDEKGGYSDLAVNEQDLYIFYERDVLRGTGGLFFQRIPLSCLQNPSQQEESMNYLIHGRKPASVFAFFEEISAIPRPSYHEEKIADYLVDFAKTRGLEYHRDAAHNVLIKAPATPGLEDHPPVLFQGHTDMVCEKNADVEHDFLKDPLKLRLDGNLLRATGTTLGADNGIAVAMMLALLDGEVPAHPAIECLFTTAEEVGLDGATTFDYSKISARRMVNMDSEALGWVTAGCAGGLRTDLTLHCGAEPFAGEALQVSVRGLMGGHSGENINSGRANANKLMGRLLAALLEEQDARVIRLSGGSKDNAIPRECQVLLAVPDAEAATARLTEVAAEMANELSADDKGFCLVCEDAPTEAVMFTREDTLRLATVLAGVANGVLSMSHHIKGLVEFSRNLGVIRTEGEDVTFVLSTRSSIESQLDASIHELNLFAKLLGAEVRHYSRYPGWAYATTSRVRDAYLAAYRQVCGKEAGVNVIHAGLECGVISSKVPGMDIISIGPDMRDIHSPDEALDLDSVELFWKTLEAFIALL
ncbi:MAG: beta-Ala-His dipeptidase [Clostridia bacterium]|nr:beta-Ala-His dipeptidase [Clostridia bacterium]